MRSRAFAASVLPCGLSDLSIENYDRISLRAWAVHTLLRTVSGVPLSPKVSKHGG